MKIDYIEQIAQALEAPTKNSPVPVETILVCASRSEGRRIISAVTAQGHILVGVRPETPFTLARELCDLQLSKPDAPRLIEEVEAAELVRSCVDKNARIFSGVNAKTLTATRAIYRTFQEMAMAGIPMEIPGLAELKQPKLLELQQMREAYQNKKRADEQNQRSALLDRADLFEKAIAVAAQSPNTPLRRAHYVVLGDYAPAHLERRLLDTLAGEDRLHVVNLPCADYTDPDTEMPYLPIGAMATAEAERVDTIELLKAGIRPAGSSDDTAEQEKKCRSRFVACRGVETEVRFPLRDILVRDRKLEDCAIVYLSSSYAQPLYEEAARFDIPVTLGGGMPLMGSQLYTTLKRIQNLPEGNYYAEDVCELLSIGGLSPESRGALAETLRRKKVGWGRARYALATRFEAKDCPDNEDPVKWAEKQKEQKELLEEWDNCLQLMLAVAAGDGDVPQQRDTMLKFLPYCNHANKREAAAHAKAKDLVEHITKLDGQETVLSRLLTLMETNTYMNGKAEPGKLYCAPLSQAAGIHRKYLYIMGFSRYAMQGRRRESPILLDAERKLINDLLADEKGGVLKNTAQQGREQEFRVRQLIARHGGDFILTYPDFDSDRMLEQAPAPYFAEAAGDQVEYVTYLPQSYILPVDHALGEEGTVKINAPKAWVEKDCEPAELQLRMSRKEQMEEIPFSATMLEEAARCPYAFYLRRLLKIRAPKPVKRDQEKWLNAAEIGTFCHAVLEYYYTPGQTKTLDELFDEEFEKLKEEVPLPRTELEDETRDQLMTMLKRAVEWVDGPENADGYGKKVLATEKWFQDLPMTFASRWTLQMQGSIDRVDQLDNGDLAILDYKTGNPDRHKEEGHKHWQHYLYARAQEDLNPDPNNSNKVAHAGYFFLSEDAADEDMLLKITEDAAERELCGNRIAWVLDQVADENWLPHCLPRYKLLKVKKRNLAGEMAEEKIGKSVALSQCKSWCEFASICPEQKGGFDND